jgi:acetylornithine/succinyldiaminopimelate/putrescine aminotransferase
VVRLLPPYVITPGDIEEGLATLDRAIGSVGGGAA